MLEQNRDDSKYVFDYHIHILSSRTTKISLQCSPGHWCYTHTHTHTLGKGRRRPHRPWRLWCVSQVYIHIHMHHIHIHVPWRVLQVRSNEEEREREGQREGGGRERDREKDREKDRERESFIRNHVHGIHVQMSVQVCICVHIMCLARVFMCVHAPVQVCRRLYILGQVLGEYTR